jgi:hypothetical protein
MASLYKRDRSPFWYLEFRDAQGVYRNRSTGLRHASARETAQARQLRAEAEAAEFSRAPGRSGGWDWVDGWLESIDVAAPTLVRYRGAWAHLAAWLLDRRLAPGDLRHTHAAEYLDWRLADKRRSGKRAGRNTVLLETKIMGLILQEAVRRDIIAANPWLRLNLKRAPRRRGRELTDDEIHRCLEALQGLPDEARRWMEPCFHIALHTGCRLRETVIPLKLVDIDGNPPCMTFPCPKGGEDKAFSIPVPAALLPMFREMKARRLAVTLKMPFQPSRHWQRFFAGLGIDGVWFHCLRVTRVTRLRRAGVPREVAMRLVNHSDELVHRLYDRHRVADLAQWVDRGGVPGAL